MRRNFLAFLGVLALANPAHAQLVAYTDGNFLGWSREAMFAADPYSSGQDVVVVGAPGHPDPYLDMYTYNSGYTAYGHMSLFSWDPSAQGAITSLSVSYEYTGLGGTTLGFGTLARQGGNFFLAPNSPPGSNFNVAASASGWQLFTNAIEPLSGWCQVYPTFSNTCGPAALDFTATGGQIDFGVYTSNFGASDYTRGGLDDFAVTITHETPVTTPEPATIGLVAIGLVGVMGFSRRRSKRPC